MHFDWNTPPVRGLDTGSRAGAFRETEKITQSAPALSHSPHFSPVHAALQSQWEGRETAGERKWGWELES